MLTKRIIPCLDVTLDKKGGCVVKGTEFVNLKEAGDPVELAKKYNEQGADELVFLDITASYEKRRTMIDVIERTSNEVFIPLTVGGGIKDIDSIRNILRAGADKVSINTAAVKNPELIKESSEIFGSQCIVTAIDCKRNLDLSKKDINVIETEDGNKVWYEVVVYGGRKRTGIDAVKWAEKVEKLGSGEILLTSMDKDGTKNGFDIPITKTLSEILDIPIIASGGAGNIDHIYDAFKKGKADAALAASIFHFNEYTVTDVKKELKKKGIEVRF